MEGGRALVGPPQWVEQAGKGGKRKVGRLALVISSAPPLSRHLRISAETGVASKVGSSSSLEWFWFVLVRVTSWIILSFLDKRNDPRNHTNRTRNSLPPKSTFEAKLL